MTVPVLDLRLIRAQVSLFNALAGQVGGHLAIRSGGLNPTTIERGRPVPLPPIEHDFPEGAIGPAIDFVLRLNREPGRNVHLAVVIAKEEDRPDGPELIPGFAVAIENAQAAAWSQRLPFLPNVVLSTGSGAVCRALSARSTGHGGRDRAGGAPCCGGGKRDCARCFGLADRRLDLLRRLGSRRIGRARAAVADHPF